MGCIFSICGIVELTWRHYGIDFLVWHCKTKLLCSWGAICWANSLPAKTSSFLTHHGWVYKPIDIPFPFLHLIMCCKEGGFRKPLAYTASGKNFSCNESERQWKSGKESSSTVKSYVLTNQWMALEFNELIDGLLRTICGNDFTWYIAFSSANVSVTLRLHGVFFCWYEAFPSHIVAELDRDGEGKDVIDGCKKCFVSGMFRCGCWCLGIYLTTLAAVSHCLYVCKGCTISHFRITIHCIMHQGEMYWFLDMHSSKRNWLIL